MAGGLALVAGCVLLTLWALPATSPLRSPDGDLTAFTAPLMRSIVPLIFLIFLLPGVAYGTVAGTVKTAKDVVQGMSKAIAAWATTS